MRSDGSASDRGEPRSAAASIEVGLVELFRALGALSETPRPELQPIADLLELGPLPTPAAHGELFAFQLYPYASVYLGAEGMMGGEAADRIAGFWRALGRTPPAEPDQLALMLGLHTRLGELEGEAAPGVARDRWRHARAAFLWEHLLSWLPVFLLELAELAAAADPFYRRWGRLLHEALREEAAALALPPPPDLPLHLRAAPALADPRRDGPQGFLRSLLTPVRSGMVLARADLARAARELELGLRPGGRQEALTSLLEQEPAATLGWLAATAAAWVERHQPEAHLAAPLAAFWRRRAEATASLLDTLKADL
jgi:Nitrate reductase delta subunit